MGKPQKLLLDDEEMQPAVFLPVAKSPAHERPSRKETSPEPAIAEASAPESRGATSQAADPAVASADQPKRNKLRIFLMLAGIAAVVVGGGKVWLGGGRYVSTDNAYVRAAKLMVSTDVSGIVSSVDVKEGESVAAGQILFRVDPQQFDIAVRIADAQLAQTKIALEAAQQDYQRLLSDIQAQQSQIDLAQVNYDRAASLLQSNAGTRAAFDQTRFALATARNQISSLHAQAQAALTRLGGAADSPVEQLPQYLLGKAQVDEARRQLDHTIVRAPFAGIVTAVDHLQPGTFLVSQTAALTNTGAVALVATDDVWIDANVKETDLTYTKSNDPVDVTIDAYPGRVWRGRVASIAPASGSEFSILPAQNASGNWVKVVQRVPVRIAFDQGEDTHLLRSGMSVNVEIDTGHSRIPGLSAKLANN